MLALPSHILTQIALDVLENPREEEDDLPMSKTKLIPESSVEDFLSFTRTCYTLNQIDVPTNIWGLLISHSIHRWKLGLLARWRANPTGVGSISQLNINLDAEFVVPVELFVSDLLSNDEDSGLTVRDVFYWWTFDPAWRSRRRVWYCIVHACATARDADWW